MPALNDILYHGPPDHDKNHPGKSSHDATYYRSLDDPRIPSSIKDLTRRILQEPRSFSEKVAASGLRKVGNENFNERRGNSNTAPGINRVLIAAGARPGDPWCAAGVTDDLRTAAGGRAPIGSAGVAQLFSQASAFPGALHAGSDGIKPGDLASHRLTGHVFEFLASDPTDQRYCFCIDANGQDWDGSRPQEGQRLVRRPLADIKGYISTDTLMPTMQTTPRSAARPADFPLGPLQTADVKQAVVAAARARPQLTLPSIS